MKLDAAKIKSAIEEMVKDYKLEPSQILEITKIGIKTAFKKDYIPGENKVSLLVQIAGDGMIRIGQEFEVVDDVEEIWLQMDLSTAQQLNPIILVGQKVIKDITPNDLQFTRIAAQSAAQAIKGQIKVFEKEKFFDKFQDKKWELLKAKILRAIGETVILDIEGTSVVLPPEWQISGKMYNPGEDIFVLLRDISKDTGGITLDITQTSPDWIESLLYKMIPELEEWKVAVDKIVRFPGKRTKVVVSSEHENVDPVGVFIGQKGSRIETLLYVLDGEKIDFIEYVDDNDAKFVADSLKPAKVDAVRIEWSKAFVQLPENQKALAIGRGAVNIKLATELSGYMIEIED